MSPQLAIHPDVQRQPSTAGGDLPGRCRSAQPGKPEQHKAAQARQEGWRERFKWGRALPKDWPARTLPMLHQIPGS